MQTEPPFEPPAPSDETPEDIRPRIRQREPAFRIPPVTFWLIAVNILVHAVRQFLPEAQDDAVVNALGFNPLSLRGPMSAMGLVSLLTYQFLHGSWDHLVFNMVALLAFGAGIERMLGPARYLGLYLAAGILGALLEGIFTVKGGDGVMVGASASISGLFGALLALFIGAGKRAAFILPMALLWIGLMAVTGILGVGAEGMPVAWIAHIGGFLTGLAYGFLLRAKRRT